MFKKKVAYFGFLGLLGFISFRYFQSGQISDLAYIGFFGYFSYFFIGKISGGIIDERYREDTKTARAFMGNVALGEFAVLMVLGILFPRFAYYLPAIVSACFASLLILYAAKLYKLEEE